MGTLLKLKKFMPIERAAIHLTEELGETYMPADVLQLGIEGHLRLSVNFVNNAVVQRGRCLDEEDSTIEITPTKNITPDCLALFNNKAIPHRATLKEIKSLPEEIIFFIQNKELIATHIGDHITGECPYHNKFFEFEDEILFVDGIFRLCMTGGEGQDVEDAFQKLTNGQKIQKARPKITLVENTNGTYFRILKRSPEKPELDPNSYYPASGLPNDADIVIQTQDLQHFIESHKNSATLSPKDKKETKTNPSRKKYTPQMRRDVMLEVINVLKTELSNLNSKAGTNGARKLVVSHCMKNYKDIFCGSTTTHNNDWQQLPKTIRDKYK